MYSRRVTFPCSNSWTKKEMEKYSGSLFVLRKAEPRGMGRWWKGCLLDIWFCRIYMPFHLNWLPEILITTYLHFYFIICLFRKSVALCIILCPCNATIWFNFLGCPYVVCNIHLSCLCQHTKNVIPKYSTSAFPQRWLFQGLKTIITWLWAKRGFTSEFCVPLYRPH